MAGPELSDRQRKYSQDHVRTSRGTISALRAAWHTLQPQALLERNSIHRQSCQHSWYALAFLKPFQSLRIRRKLTFLLYAGNRTIHERDGIIGAHHARRLAQFAWGSTHGLRKEVKTPVCPICKEVMYYSTIRIAQNDDTQCTEK